MKVNDNPAKNYIGCWVSGIYMKYTVENDILKN